MLRAIDQYFHHKEEPAGSCLQALREFILNYDFHLTEAWKYGMPFYCYGGKMCCYLWTHKKYKQPYMGFVEGSKIHHPDLLLEKRARMKILLVDPEKDLPVKLLNKLLKQMVELYK